MFLNTGLKQDIGQNYPSTVKIKMIQVQICVWGLGVRNINPLFWWKVKGVNGIFTSPDIVVWLPNPGWIWPFLVPT